MQEVCTVTVFCVVHQIRDSCKYLIWKIANSIGQTLRGITSTLMTEYKRFWQCIEIAN